MTIAELVRAMSAAGAPPEAIAIALEAIEQRDNAERDRKAKRAAQKRAERERVARQSHDNAATVAPQTPAPSPEKEKSPHTPLKEKQTSSPIPKSSLRSDSSSVVDDFLDRWAVLASQCGLAPVRAVTDARKARILARARDLTTALDFPDAAAGFADLMTRIRGSPLLTGQVGDRRWKADIDWVLSESNFLKIMEGKYAASPKPNGSYRVAGRV